MTPQDFDTLSRRLIGQTIQSLYPGGITTLGIGLANKDFITITSHHFDLIIGPVEPADPSAKTLVSEPSDGIL